MKNQISGLDYVFLKEMNYLGGEFLKALTENVLIY